VTPSPDPTPADPTPSDSTPSDEPAPPRPRRPTGQRLAVIVAAIVVICCGGLAGVGYFVYTLVGSATDPMRGAAVTFLDGLRERNYPTAFGMLCDSAREKYDLDTFMAREAARPLDAYAVTGVYADDRSGAVDGRVTVTLEYADGTRESRALPMVSDHDEWRVCGDPY
jgi:hypothetical protein